MSGFDTPALLEAVAAILVDVAGMQSVTIGVPGSFPAQVNAYVTVGPQSFPEHLETFGGDEYGRLTRVVSIFCGFAYAVTNGPYTAELVLAAYVDEFTRKVLRAPELKALCEDYSVDFNTNSLPEYRDWSGRETRHWWASVNFQQTEEI